jgi:hypothetical protein
MRAGGAEDVGFDGGGDQVAVPLQDGWDDRPVGLEGSRWAEGQDRVALLDGQVEVAQEAVADAVAAAQDDPPPPQPQDKEAAQLATSSPTWPRAPADGGEPGATPAERGAHRRGRGARR